MARLQKDASTGRLLKNSSGRLANVCDVSSSSSSSSEVHWLYEVCESSSSSSFAESSSSTETFSPVGSSSSSSSSESSFGQSSSSSSSSVDSSSSSSGGIVTCSPPGASAGPEMLVTLTWSGGPATYTYFGCVWNNGETKALKPTSYNVSTLYENWGANYNSYNSLITAYAQGVTSGNPSMKRKFRVNSNLGLTGYAYLYSTRNWYTSSLGGSPNYVNINTPIQSRTFSDAVNEWGPASQRVTNMRSVGLTYHGGSVTISGTPNVTVSWTPRLGTGWKKEP